MQFLFMIYTISISFAFKQLKAPTISSIKRFSSSSSHKVFSKSKPPTTDIICVEDVYQDMWKIQPAVEILKNGGVGVISTDTCYSFVTIPTSVKGIEKIMQLKGVTHRKPLSMLCLDIKMVSQYTNYLNEKWIYKLLKATLPGPFTYIMPCTAHLPKLTFEHNKHTRRYKRKEIGIKIPSDPVCTAILQKLGEPLMSGSVPEAAEDIAGFLYPDDIIDLTNEDPSQPQADYESEIVLHHDYMKELGITEWLNSVDFVIDAGPRGIGGIHTLSTVVDLTSGKPVVIRQGEGVYDFSSVPYL